MKIVIKDLEKNYNVAQESDGKIFLKWSSVIIWCIIWLFILFLFIAQILIPFVSLEDEKRLFWNDVMLWKILDDETQRIQKYIWKEFPYKVVVVDSAESNAFALPWGTIAFTKSFLEEVVYENSFLFVLGHEKAHVDNRDVFRWLVSEVPMRIIFVLLGFTGNIDFSYFISPTVNFYSKTMEKNADIFGIDFVYAQQGDVSCALELFMKKSSLWENILTLLSGHPMTDSRIDYIEQIISRKNYPYNNECKKFEY